MAAVATRFGSVYQSDRATMDQGRATIMFSKKQLKAASQRNGIDEVFIRWALKRLPEHSAPTSEDGLDELAKDVRTALKKAIKEIAEKQHLVALEKTIREMADQYKAVAKPPAKAVKKKKKGKR